MLSTVCICLSNHIHIWNLCYFKVTRSVDYDDKELSPQEEKTIKAIADAR
jgi:hypothetical protein